MTTILSMQSQSAMDARARRAAKRVGLVASKTRWRKDSVDNFGGFMLIDASSNVVTCGTRWDMSAEEVIEYCREFDDR